MLQKNDYSSLVHPLVRAALSAAELEPQQGYQCVPVAALLQKHHPMVEIELPLIIYGFSAQAPTPELSRLQAILQNAYPDTHPVTLITDATEQGAAGNVQQITLQELARVSRPDGNTIPQNRIAQNTILCVPPLPAGSSFSALQAIIAHLRAPDGCPWDRKQTLMTMRHDLLSECAEVLEAIDLDSTLDNGAHIAEELGDLLMAGVLMIQIATDTGRFQMADAVQGVVTKLIRRHPHVFGDVVVDGVETVLTTWDAIKAQEKAEKGQTQVHPLDGVPATLPALEKARQLQSKAAKQAYSIAAVAQTAPSLPQSQQSTLTEEELGERLWQIVALAHTAGLNAEDALRSYSIRFRAAHIKG